MSNTKVTQLPPTLGIKDPEVRMFLDALVNAWDHRSGNTDYSAPERFITAGEFKTMANKALVEALSDSLPGDGSAQVETGPVSEIIDSIADSIRRSILYQMLGTEYPNIDISDLQSRISAAYDGAKTLFLEERQQRETEYTAMTSSITAQASRIQAAEAAIVSEAQTRVNKDNALAEAVNTMWAKIGGSQAVIQDGQLAAISPTAVQATKWDQVQVAVRDPNTGLPSSTSIKQELTSYSNSANGKFNSMYTVRAQVTQNGKTVVGGFGLAAIAGADSPQGPTIEFGVRADTFFIASPSSRDELFPFTVYTSPTTINGVPVPAGVYITNAAIANGSIDTAKIGIRISSNNFNGALNANGSISTVGTTGWAIDKNGMAVFNNIHARGNIEASTVKANVIETSMIKGAAITQMFSSSGLNPSVSFFTGAEGISGAVAIATGDPIYVKGDYNLGSVRLAMNGSMVQESYGTVSTAIGAMGPNQTVTFSLSGRGTLSVMIGRR